MIFLTVGTQLPFPRLAQAMNDLAPMLDDDVVAQTGEDGDYPNLQAVRDMPPHRFSEVFEAARLVVAHAGIGTVLTARKLNKPLILVPRRASFQEHRNDHQLATARQLEKRKGVKVVWDTEDLATEVGSMQERMTAEPGLHYNALLSELRAFIG